MGAGESVTINLSFNRSNPVYYGGEKVTGNISFQNMQHKLKIEEFLVELIGELSYPTQEIRWHSDAKGRSRKEQYTQHRRITLLKIPASVSASTYGKKKFTLRSGSYSLPFELLLPNHLPPTLTPASSEHAYVKYYMQIMLDKPWSSPSAIPTYSLIVSPRVNLFHINNAQGLVQFSNQNRKKLQLNCVLLNNGVVAGQHLSIQIDLQNPKGCQIKRIEATFIQHRQIAGIRNQNIIFNCNLPGINKFQETVLKQNFDLTVPVSYLPPTYEYTTIDIDPFISVFVHYELLLSVKMNGIFTDFQVNIPVNVGTESIFDRSSQQQSDNPLEMSANDKFTLDQTDLPPSYEMAILNKLK